MAYVFHPKRVQRCAFCKRWDGDAKLTFKNPQQGFQFEAAMGKCMASNGNKKPSHEGQSCQHYEPSVEVSRIL